MAKTDEAKVVKMNVPQTDANQAATPLKEPTIGEHKQMLKNEISVLELELKHLMLQTDLLKGRWEFDGIRKGMAEQLRIEQEKANKTEDETTDDKDDKK